jgi:hypothetical protein
VNRLIPELVIMEIPFGWLGFFRGPDGISPNAGEAVLTSFGRGLLRTIWRPFTI